MDNKKETGKWPVKGDPLWSFFSSTIRRVFGNVESTTLSSDKILAVRHNFPRDTLKEMPYVGTIKDTTPLGRVKMALELGEELEEKDLNRLRNKYHGQGLGKGTIQWLKNHGIDLTK